MEIKKHFKLYKSGKQWVTASIAIFAVSTGLVLGGGVVHAADNHPITTSASVTNAINNLNQENDNEDQNSSQGSNTVESPKKGTQDSKVQPLKETAVIPNATNDNGVKVSTTDDTHTDNTIYGNIDSTTINDNELHVTGWNATNQAINKDESRYVIAYDDTTNSELGRTKITDQVARPDVERVHKDIYNAQNSGFNVNVSLDFNKMNSYRDAIKIISRYSGVPDGNSDYVDFVSQPIIFDENNYAYLDDFAVQNGKLHVSGWNATNKAIQRPNHFLILFDRTAKREVARQKVTAGINRSDVEKVYPQVVNASVSGFDATFDITNLNPNDEYQILSRYSNNDDGEGDYVTYWFNPQRITPANQFNDGHLDNFNISEAGKVTVSGWQATNLSNIQNNRYIILFDTTANRQIASMKVTGIDRPDVAKVYPQILNANKSGYNVIFDLTQAQIAQLLPNHSYSIVSRYSADANGNGNDKQHTDFWSTPIVLNKTASYIDGISLNGDVLTVKGWMASDASATQANPYGRL